MTKGCCTTDMLIKSRRGARCSKYGTYLLPLLVAALCVSPAWAKRTIYGTITDMTGKPAAGMLIKAWDDDSGSSNDFMGQATTNSNGYYKIGPFKAKHWDPAPHNITTWRPDIFIEVYAKIGGKWIKVKQSGVHKNRKHKYDTKIDLKLTGISGVIKDARGPAPGVLVRAWDSDGVDKNDFLNESKTDSQGRYLMMYEGKHWDPAPHNVTTWRPDIFIKVLRNVGRYGWVKVGESKKYNDWPHAKHLTINLNVPENKWITKKTRFDPKKHGWPFRNDRFKICAKPTCKDEHPSNKVPIWGRIGAFRWALCGGMSLSALTRFRNGKPVSNFSPKIKEELVEAQFATLLPTNWTRFLKWTAKPDLPHTTALHTIGQSTKEEWPKLRRAVDRGAPIIMGLIRAGPSNTASDISSNHQVVAIGYRYNDGTKEVEIYAYDPNYDGVVSTISLSIGVPRNQLMARQITTYKGQVYREKVRGFFVIDVGSGPPRASVRDAATQKVAGSEGEPVAASVAWSRK